MDAYTRDPAGYRFDPAWMNELESVSHREYATGFYLDDPMKQPQLVQGGHYIQEKAYFGTAVAYDTPEALAELEAIREFEPKFYAACMHTFGASYELTERYRKFKAKQV